MALLEGSFSVSGRPDQGRAGGGQGHSISPCQRGTPSKAEAGSCQSVVTNRKSRPGLIPHWGSQSHTSGGQGAGPLSLRRGKDPGDWRERALRLWVPLDLARTGLPFSSPCSWASELPGRSLLRILMSHHALSHPSSHRNVSAGNSGSKAGALGWKYVCQDGCQQLLPTL